MALAKIFCEHREIIQNNSEIVCNSCGVILDEKLPVHEDVFNSDRSMVNLFEVREHGSKNPLPKSKANERIRRYFHDASIDANTVIDGEMLSKFSNVSEKLDLGKAQAEYAWRLFVKSMRGKTRRHSPEIAVWAIYHSCKVHGISNTGDEIRDAVMMVWGRSTIQHMTGILYDNMDSERSRPEDTEKYYFHLSIRKMLQDRRMSSKEFAEGKKQAWDLFSNVFVNGNISRRANEAVRTAFGL